MRGAIERKDAMPDAMPDGAPCSDALPWRELIELIEVGAFVLDREKRVLLWNAWMVRMSGFAANYALGRPIAELFPDHTRSRFFMAIDAALVDGVASFLSRALNPDPLPLRDPDKGEPVAQNIALRPLKAEDGAALCHIQVLDVTDGLRRERYLRQQATEIRAARDQLQISNREKDKFFSIIAHDLRSPFTSLVGLTRAMSDYGADMSAKQLIAQAKIVSESAESVLELVDNLLQWATLQMNGIEIAPKKLSLRDAAQKAITLFAANAAEKSISLKNEVDPEAMAMADPSAFDTVIRNLTNNAIKFTPAGGAVAYSSEKTEDGFALAIADTGVGMTESQLEGLFGLDHHNSTEGTAGERGTGLGLILCRDLIDRNGGAIRVESAPGQGSRFTLTLPPA